MAAFTFVKLLLAGCLLYLSSSLGDASLAKVTSVTSNLVNQAVSAHVNVFGHGKQASRSKRDVQSQKLEDPKGCILACRDNETSQMTTAMMRNMARLVALALEDIKGDEVDTPEKEAAFKKQVEDKTIANMGPLFEDLCRIQKSKGLCLSKCPESQARSILSIDNEGTQAALCEPSRNWDSFPTYWTALNCTNTTEDAHPCDEKCGPEVPLRNATHMSLDEEEASEEKSKGDGDDDDIDLSDLSISSGPLVFKYETDSKKNNAAAGPACKAISCRLECFKPIITKQCGAKAYEMYARATKNEPHETLGMLKVVKAIDTPDECKAFE